MSLIIRGDQPLSVFRLNGADENSGTFALGWALERSPHFLSLFIEAVFNEALNVENAAIALQRPDQDRGYTDLEVQSGRSFHAILEAKRWWEVPSIEQLARYHPRLVTAGAERKRLISVSAAERSQAFRLLPTKLEGIPVVHLSWGDLQRLAQDARSLASGFEEKLWLRQLVEHFREFVTMERHTDNRVFVVSLGQLATQMLKVSGGPAAYVDADVLASALKKIDPELPRKVTGSDRRGSATPA